MPTYDYKCPRGHVFERFQKMSDPPEGTCPECGEHAERQISAGAGLVFKGSGFYITDYKRAGEKGDSAESPEAKDPSKTQPKKTSDKSSGESEKGKDKAKGSDT